MGKKVKTACGLTANEAAENLNEESAAENLDEESAIQRNEQQASVKEALENLDEKLAAGRNGKQPCVKEAAENLGSTSQNLHVNQEMSPDLAERGKSPVAKSKKTSDKDEQFELNEL